MWLALPAPGSAVSRDLGDIDTSLSEDQALIPRPCRIAAHVLLQGPGNQSGRTHARLYGALRICDGRSHTKRSAGDTVPKRKEQRAD